MKISYTSDSRYDIGEPVPIPNEFKKYQIEWGSETHCMKYPEGYIYTQTFSCSRFDMTLRIYRLNQAVWFYATEDHPSLYLYFMLRGQFQFIDTTEKKMEIAAKDCGMQYLSKGSSRIGLPEGTHQVLHLRLKTHYLKEIAQNNQHLPSFYALLQETMDTDQSILHTCINPDINQELLKLLNASGEKSQQLYKLYGTVDNILSHYFSELDGMAADEEKVLHSVAEKLRAAILEDPSNEHQLKHIAMEHNVDARSLSRLYRDKYHERLTDTRKEGIMVKAMSLITETMMTIEDIAYLLGYSDRRALSRAIKKELGQTPESLRKLYGKQIAI